MYFPYKNAYLYRHLKRNLNQKFVSNRRSQYEKDDSLH